MATLNSIGLLLWQMCLTLVQEQPLFMIQCGILSIVMVDQEKYYLGAIFKDYFWTFQFVDIISPHVSK